MNIAGKQVADEIKEALLGRVSKLSRKPRLDIFYVGKNPVIEGFLRMKQRTGEYIGVETVVHHFPSDVKQDVLIEEIRKISEDKKVDGIIIQLPLPSTFNTDEILSAVPTEKDVDVLSEKALLFFEQEKSSLLPPVVGAIAEILKRNSVSVASKKVVVLGNGRLVGRPAAAWFKQQGAMVTVLDKADGDPISFLQKADMVVSGVGSPGIIQPNMIQERVMLFDAGASEEDGEVWGDADPLCSHKCLIFTPVPGGIGPITVALLFRNLLDIVETQTS